MEKTCLRVILGPEGWPDIRAFLHTFGPIQQVFIPPKVKRIAFVNYTDESDAEAAKTALEGDPRVDKVMPMDKWPFVQCDEDSKPDVAPQQMPENAFTHVMQCTYCRCLIAEWSCTVCGAWYCSPECQLDDFVNHKEICIPRLMKVR